MKAGESEGSENSSDWGARDQMKHYRGPFDGQEEMDEERTDIIFKESLSPISSLSEFESIHRVSQADEFFYLRNDFENKLSYIADMQELHSRDELQFFRTYQ